MPEPNLPRPLSPNPAAPLGPRIPPPPPPAAPPPVAPPVAAETPHRRGWPPWLRLLTIFLGSALIVGAAAATALARFGGAYGALPYATELALPDATKIKGDPSERAVKLEQKLGAYAPKDEVYVVVETYANRLRVFRGRELLREAVCSTGSGILLKDPRNQKVWTFDTPIAELKILRKQKNPIWIKPDWAFVEEGFLPPKNAADRVDDFSLGDYGLYMRDGYIIHGTIFKTLLGKRVTHGCIRLGDEDLKYVYDTVPVGARVFLY